MFKIIYKSKVFVSFILTLFLIQVSFLALAQEAEQQKSDTTYWSNTGSLGLTFSNTQLDNWKAGGKNSQTINLVFNKTYKFEKDRHLWVSLLETSYGIQKQGSNDNPFSKIDDLLHINSLYGYKIYKRWYLSYSIDLRTQWAVGEETKDLNGDGNSKVEEISSFMSPGFIVSGLALSYKYNFGEEDFFIANFSPVSNFKLTTIMDQAIFDGYKAGEKAFGIDKGNLTKFEWGLLTIGGQIQKSISKNTKLNSNLTLFTPIDKAGDFDVNFDVIINSKINKWLGITWTYNLVYDDDVSTNTQTKWILGIGLNVKI